MYEDAYQDNGIAFNSENFDFDEEGAECMEPGNFEECMYDNPSKNCGCWKDCKAGNL
jgi:hypothetical protein